MYSIKYLLENSNLPGPRGNLELLYAFSKEAGHSIVSSCLNYIKDNISNSPAEFVGMCGIVGYAVINKSNMSKTVSYLRKYASHNSWRIREAVAIGIQEIAFNKTGEILGCLESWINGNYYEKRAVVAALCEPKLLSDSRTNIKILKILTIITDNFNNLDLLDDEQKVLKKSLGYGWSVAIASQPKEGKIMFESYKRTDNKHIKWIIKENLKKNRLIKLDKSWVKKLNAAIV